MNVVQSRDRQGNIVLSVFGEQGGFEREKKSGEKGCTCSKTFPTPVLTSNDDGDENEEAGDCLSSKASRRCSPMILFVVAKSSRYARMGGTSHCHVSSTSCIYHNLDDLTISSPPRT